jgi:O-antigen biosynthesis protein WbqP
MTKRFLDLALSVSLLLAFAIPMALVALAIRLTSRGPILYWSSRVGRNNRLFAMPKFRSMRIDTPEVATHLLEDSRQWMTPLGPLLRKTSLDELPQLWSILIGQMSFVGPRPALHNQRDLIELRTALGVHRLLPGLTGWAQIHGRDEVTVTEKARLDEWYLRHNTCRLDIYIAFVTIWKVLRRDGVVDSAADVASNPVGLAGMHVGRHSTAASRNDELLSDTLRP